MPARQSKKDFSQVALEVVEAATGAALNGHTKNPAAVALGKLGARKGGLARAKKLSAKQRKTIAKRAAKARWHLNGNAKA
jgi:hypothetical protein